MNSLIFWPIPIASIIALVFAWIFFKSMMKGEEGTDLMIKIASHVRKGAMAYLKQQYKVVGIVFLIITLVFAFLSYGLGVQNGWLPAAFLMGGFFSGLAGYFGMKTATWASGRTAHAATVSLNRGLRISFRSGAVMGLSVVGLALLYISIWWVVLDTFIQAPDSRYKTMIMATTMLTFGMGASLQALFARVGGGIFTKAADVGADLVGKVEAGIPEDDPRNPATIADNVGDNVGDVAGMGADLYESYSGSILAAGALGAAAYINADPGHQYGAALAPMLIAAIGIILSIAGTFFVRTKDGATQKELLASLEKGINISAVLIIVASFLALRWLNFPNYLGVWGAIVVGLVTGMIIGKTTAYYTSSEYKPTQEISRNARTGPATVIIAGLGAGFISTAIPVLAIGVGTALAFFFASGGLDLSNINAGLYGIGIAAVGMLSTLGITLATDAYGPIVDNAGGNAEMAGLDPEVRKRTDALDSLGNTTAATGKGFAIGSAALTALALLASYFESVRLGIVNAIRKSGSYLFPDGTEVSSLEGISGLSLIDMVQSFEVHLLNPKVIIGLLLGAMMAFLFCGLTMNAVGRAAAQMVNEVRRQFREIAGILEGKSEPDYARCVEISTIGAQKEMLFPSLLVIFVPVLIGILFGVPAVIGLLAGGLSSGFSLAIFMANSGGAWDNAKKYIEEGNFGGKGSEAHKAAVIGDTVGDPFKDTSGPSLNILIKLMSMVAIVMAGVTVGYSLS